MKSNLRIKASRNHGKRNCFYFGNGAEPRDRILAEIFLKRRNWDRVGFFFKGRKPRKCVREFRRGLFFFFKKKKGGSARAQRLVAGARGRSASNGSMERGARGEWGGWHSPRFRALARNVNFLKYEKYAIAFLRLPLALQPLFFFWKLNRITPGKRVKSYRRDLFKREIRWPSFLGAEEALSLGLQLLFFCKTLKRFDATVGALGLKGCSFT